MSRLKSDIVASITRAKLELDEALEDVRSLPMLDPMILGFITHALNNYLRVSFGTLDLLGDALKDHPRKDVQVWIKGLQDATTRMKNLVNEIKSGPSKAPPQMRFEKVDLALLVSRACNFYRRMAARKQIEILFETSPSPLPKVRTDRLAVAVILDNLLSNAVKFSPPGKRVSVELAHDSGYAVCRVRDEGPGIPVQDQSRLFERGVKLKARPTGGEDSTGYGLAVAAELVANLGGDISCESGPGKGACFYFQLPCPHPQPTRARAKLK